MKQERRERERRGTNEITVDDASRVKIEQAAQDLVHKVLHVLVGERLAGADDLRQVGVHEIRHNVHVIKRVVVLWSDDVHQLQDLWESGGTELVCVCVCWKTKGNGTENETQTFSWWKCLRRRISRSSRVASVMFSNVCDTFLMATLRRLPSSAVLTAELFQQKGRTKTKKKKSNEKKTRKSSGKETSANQTSP